MPTRKEAIGTFNRGTVVEYEVTVLTTWAQIVSEGPVFLRCDDAAKETGVGTWYADDSNNPVHRASRTWEGTLSVSALREFSSFSDDLWIEDKKTFRYQYEKDYS